MSNETFLKEIKEQYLEKQKENIIRNLRIDHYADNVELFWKEQPFFYDKKQLFWWWNKKEFRYELIDETDLMNLIDLELSFAGQTISKGIKNNYIEAFKRIGRKHIPTDMPETWIQFKNKIVNITNNQEMEATPDYFGCNPIPHQLGTSEETPFIDKLFTDWVGEQKESLYEIISYACLPNYPIHLIIALVGAGRNGKTSFLRIMEQFIGKENITSTELDTLIDNRFESAKLYKKLICTMGETNFGLIQKTSLLKKLTGQDLIGYEFKNKMPFDAHNYAKIIIASNSLPTSADTTEGFYRRWFIIDFQNEFPEGKDITENINSQEYENLARKCSKTLPILISRGNFKHQGSIEDRKNKYILSSNPINLFLEKHCIIDEKEFVKSNELFKAYNQFLKSQKKRSVKKKEFKLILEEEGYFVEKCAKKINYEFENNYWIDGIKLNISKNILSNTSKNDNFDENNQQNQQKMDNFDEYTDILTRSSCNVERVGKLSNSSNLSNNQQNQNNEQKTYNQQNNSNKQKENDEIFLSGIFTDQEIIDIVTRATKTPQKGIYIEDLIKTIDVTEERIKKLIEQGLIQETPAGTIRTL